ncbi:hypothetical protein ROZALSC1DRAFT_25283, partial [Rozella allomycis CSF55]
FGRLPALQDVLYWLILWFTSNGSNFSHNCYNFGLRFGDPKANERPKAFELEDSTTPKGLNGYEYPSSVRTRWVGKNAYRIRKNSFLTKSLKFPIVSMIPTDSTAF